MKNKILIPTIVATLAIVAAFNINLIKSDNNKGDLAMANIEALAQSENTDLVNSSLNMHECNYTTSTGASPIIYKGVIIPAYTTYNVYGYYKICEREFSANNNCSKSDETGCIVD